MNDECAAVLFVRVDQLIFDTNSPTQVQSPRIFSRQHVASSLDEKAIAVDCVDDASDSITSLE